VTLNFDLDQKLSSSKSYCPAADADTQWTYCATWTTKVVGIIALVAHTVTV